MLAVSQAHRILDWLDNLPRDETPPEWMWAFEDELESWFEEVEAARERKYGGGREDADEEVPMMSNELAAAARR